MFLHPLLHENIQAWVERDRDFVAVVNGSQRLTYGELWDHSGAIAAALATQGVQPDDRVGICLDRSSVAIAVMVGILRQGGAYVPLDPQWPTARIHRAIADAQPRAIVTLPHLRHVLPPGVPVVDGNVTLTPDRESHPAGTEATLDPGDGVTPQTAPGVDTSAESRSAVPLPHPPQPDPVPLSSLTPDHLAYVIYTSGSTGQPKGVAIAHRQVVGFLRGFEQVAPGGMRPVGTALCPFTFDVAVWEIFTVLGAGGTVHVLEPTAMAIATDLVAYWRSHAITNAYVPPGLVAGVVAAIAADAGALVLRRLLVGVEPIPYGILQTLHQHLPQLAILNGYGPTETTVCATLHRVTASPQLSAQAFQKPTPIGRAIPGYGVRLLDQHCQPVPVGQVGEIWIGGVGVARGYLHRPEQTAAAFVTLPDPQGGPAQRFYRTGDRARQRPDGTLVFVGRQDRQVKIRGFRIELGEVEAAIASESQVAAVTVVTRADPLGDRTLAAYVILTDSSPSPESSVADPTAASPPSPDSAPTLRHDPAAQTALRQLQQHLRGQLPSYMQPHAWAVLTHLPRTAHGKIDVRRLPAPEVLPAAVPVRSPATPVERAIVEVWQGLLGRADFGVNDHPFDWGAHSLMMAMAIAQLRDLLGVQLGLADALAHPIPSALAAWITAQPRPDRPLDPPVPRDRLHPLTPTQQQFWVREQLAIDLDPHAASASHITLGFRVRGALHRDALGRSLTALVTRHESLRTQIHVNDQGIPMQMVVPPPAAVPLTVATLPDHPATVDAWAMAFTEAPFDLAQDLPLRVAVVNLDPQLDPGQDLGQDPRQDWGQDWGQDLGPDPRPDPGASPGASPVGNRVAAHKTESDRGGDTLILLTVHHLMVDGWSITGPLLHDWAALYAAAQGARIDLPPLAHQFVDYAVLQSQMGSALESEALPYWHDRLAGSPAAATPWSAEAAASTQARAGATQVFRIPAVITQALRAIAQREGVSLFGVFQAAFAVFVGRAADCEDFTVGIPLVDRDHPEWQNTVGLFLNTIVMRYDLSGNLPFGQWLRQVQTDWTAACQRSVIPFAALDRDRHTPDRHPWFRTLLVFNPFAAPQLPLPGLNVAYQPVPKRSVLLDLTLNLWDDGSAELVGEWEYVLDGADARLIAQLTEVWLTLLAAIATDPGQPVWSLPWLPPEDRDRAIASLTPATQPLPHDPITAIAQQATKRPTALALQAGSQTWSYGELHRQTNQLARYLRRVGVGRDTRVGMVLERGGQAILTMLAILKAGGAYVPLDPALPDARIQAILEDAQITALVTRSLWLNRLEHLCQGLSLPPVRITWERDAAVIAAEADHDLPPVADAQRLAYVIYTSGTTGQPKGVAIERRSLAHFTAAAIATYGLTPQDRMLQFASLTFDAAVEEIYPTLSVGGTLVIRPEDFLGDSAQAMAWLQTAGITVMDVPTAYWHQWVAALQSGDCPLPPAVRLVIIGGEAARPDVVRAWQGLGDRPALINTYGPTETTVVALAYPIPAPEYPAVHAHDRNPRDRNPRDHDPYDRNPRDRNLRDRNPRDRDPRDPNCTDCPLSPVPIGRPFPHVGAIALDRNHQPVPPGIAGELYLSGPALARGYLNRPELTAAAFGSLGWSRERLYRTGDRVRQRDDGAWVFLGRRDAQVKVRGFRVELMEVEAVLTRHPSVREAVVMVHPDATGAPNLVAYLVTTLRPDRLPCNLPYQATTTQQTWQGITEDWALGGVGLHGVPTAVPPGSAITLTFALTAAEDNEALDPRFSDLRLAGLEASLTLTGKLVWVQGQRGGVCWSPDSDSQAIARVMQCQQQRINFDRTVQRLVNRELRDFLATHLPAYAVPNILVPVATLPLTRHGKVDHTALAHLKTPEPRIEETSFSAPRTDLERELAKRWRKLLGVAEIHRESNFFELGGHSLLAMQVITQAGQLLGQPVPISQLYQAPTLGAFCDRLTALQTQTPHPAATPHLPSHPAPNAPAPNAPAPNALAPNALAPNAPAPNAPAIAQQPAQMLPGQMLPGQALPGQALPGQPLAPPPGLAGSGRGAQTCDQAGKDERVAGGMGNSKSGVDQSLQIPVGSRAIAPSGTPAMLPDIVVPIRATGSQAPVFCLHLLGRNLSYFQPMAAHLRCDRPLLGLSLAFSPALTALGKPPWHSVQAIAATYAATIQAVQPQGPYYLMGYSFGGIVAYEVAQQLQAQGQTVAQVILLDTSIAPTAVALPWPERWLVRWRLYWHQRRVWRQPWPVRWRRYVERAQRWANRVMVCLGPQDPAIMPATGDAMGDRPVGTFTSEGIRLEDHSWALARHYVAQPYQGAIVLIRAQRPMNSLRDYNLHRDSTLGWGPVAGPNLEIRTVLGDHVSMLRPNHAAALAAVLDDYLDVPTSLS